MPPRLLSLVLLLIVAIGCASPTPPRASVITRTDLVGRAARFVTVQYEKTYGVPIAGVELVPFESAVPGTVKWRAAEIVRNGQRVALPTKILVELPPGWVAQITTDGDERARELLASLRTTSDPACFWPLLRQMHKSAGLAVGAVNDLERRFRAAEAQGRFQELVISMRERTFVFNNNRSVGFCYTYALPGEWVGANQPQLYRAKSGRELAGLLFLSDAHLRREGY